VWGLGLWLDWVTGKDSNKGLLALLESKTSNTSSSHFICSQFNHLINVIEFLGDSDSVEVTAINYTAACVGSSGMCALLSAV